MEGESSESGTVLELSIPVQNSGLFKHGASGPILDVLADNPDLRLSVSQLADAVSYSAPATSTAIDVLEANGLVETSQQGAARLTQINRHRLRTAADPVLTIPQEAFHLPVRIGRKLIERELEGVQGIVLFGSVARGNADRRSDIDLWVLVDRDPTQQQHEANKLAADLSEMKLPSAIDMSGLLGDALGKTDGGDSPIEEKVVETYSNARPSDESSYQWGQLLDKRLVGTGERFSFEIVVESADSLFGQRDRVDPEIFTEGITLSDTPTLQRLKAEVIRSE